MTVAMAATLNMGWVGVIFFFFSSRVAKAQVEAKAMAQLEAERNSREEMEPVCSSPNSAVASPDSTISYPKTPHFNTTAEEQ